MRKAMTIGQLAKAAGVGVETIRYYQRRGLLATPSRPPGGQRHYVDAALEDLAFIRRAQQLGFSLEQIIALRGMGDGRCADGRAFALAKLEELKLRVSELNRMCRRLRVIAKQCEGNTRRAPCPLIRALKDDKA